MPAANMNRIAAKRIVAGILLTVLTARFQIHALAPHFLSGFGDAVKIYDNGGIGTHLYQIARNNGIRTDFIGHWFHPGWKGHFGPSAGSNAWVASSEFGEVIDAGLIPLVFWWWIGDNPQNTTLRQESVHYIGNDLVPFLNSIDRPAATVYVVLEPEFNTHNVDQEAGFNDHLIALLNELKNVTGVRILAGPCVGMFGYDKNTYGVENAIGRAVAESDFVAFHEIERYNGAHYLDPYDEPNPQQLNFCKSLAFYLNRKFNKPLLLPYWAINTNSYSATAQAQGLRAIFQNRAWFEAHNVEMFGSFLYIDNNEYAEGLVGMNGSTYPSHDVWKQETDRIADNSDGTHSIAFVSPDYADVVEGATEIQWISRGKNGTITYSLFYRMSGEPDVLIAENISGNSSLVNRYQWDPELIVSPNMELIVRSSDGAEASTGRIAVRSATTTSNATCDFEEDAEWTIDRGTVAIVENEMSMSGTRSLKVVHDFDSEGWVELECAVNAAYTGEDRISLVLFVPFELNPSMELGSAISRIRFQVQMMGSWRTIDSDDIPLNQGWNSITWKIPGQGDDSKGLYALRVRVYQNWGAPTGTPPVYIDDVKIGGELVFGATGTVSTANSGMPPPDEHFSIAASGQGLRIELRGSRRESMDIVLLNAQGCLVKRATAATGSGGNSLLLDAGDLPGGIYFCVVSSNRATTTERILLAR